MEYIEFFEDISPEDKEAFNNYSSGETYTTAQIVAKVIVYAKEIGILPCILEPLTDTPEKIATISAKVAFSIDIVKKLIDGDIDTYEKLLTRIIDISYVIAVSTVDIVSDVGPKIIKMASEFVTDFLMPGSGDRVGHFVDSISHEISSALKELFYDLLSKYEIKTKEAISSWFNSLREKELSSSAENTGELRIEEMKQSEKAFA